MFFRFRQNNTGGEFDPAMPLTLYVEAQNAQHANDRAESFGVYFDGCRDGTDCPCCGDRWCRAGAYDEYEAPDVAVDAFDRAFASRTACAVRVEYLDGQSIDYPLPSGVVL